MPGPFEIPASELSSNWLLISRSTHPYRQSLDLRISDQNETLIASSEYLPSLPGLPALKETSQPLLSLAEEHLVKGIELDRLEGLDPKVATNLLGNEDDPSYDIWQGQEGAEALELERRLLTWESFLRSREVDDSQLRYISKVPAPYFDAAIQKWARESPQKVRNGSFLCSHALFRSLWQLGLGLQSTLFPYNDAKGCFDQATQDVRISGCTAECSQAMIGRLMQIGQSMRTLQEVRENFAAKEQLQTRASLWSAIASVCESIEAHVISKRPDVKTLMQLASIFDSCSDLAHFFAQLVHKTRHVTTDKRIAEFVYEAVLDSESRNDDLCHIACSILKRIFAPLMSRIGYSIGLGMDIASSNITIRDETGTGILAGDKEDEEDDEVFPNFMNADIRRTIRETRWSFRFLRRFGRIPCIYDCDSSMAYPVSLEWAFTFEELQSLQIKARKYQSLAAETSEEQHFTLAERSRRGAVTSTLPLWQGYRSQNRGFRDLWESTRLAIESAECTDSSPFAFHEITRSASITDEIGQEVASYLSSNSDANAYMDHHERLPVQWSLSLSLQSLLEKQHALLKHSVLRLILQATSPESCLRTHLQMHHAFYLCASGSFNSRLRAVLFSSEAETTERQKGVTRTGGAGRGMGLRLGSGERKTWPPASSEIRLALMGILEESWRYEKLLDRGLSIELMERDNVDNPTIRPDVETPALHGLSFSLHTDLSQSQVDKVLEPSSIAALDFLRLSYTPPAILRDVFTPRALDMYDRIFGSWLRLARVEHVLGELFLAMRRYPASAQGSNLSGSVKGFTESNLAHRLRHRLTTFFRTLLQHFHLAVVDGTWHALCSRLNGLEEACRDPVPNVTYTAIPLPTLTELAKLHEATVTQIASGMFLRKRQRKLADALEKLCEDALSFYACIQTFVAPDESGEQGSTVDPGPQSIDSLLMQFETHLSTFQSACTEYTDKYEHCGRSGEETVEGVTAIKGLLLMISRDRPLSA